MASLGRLLSLLGLLLCGAASLGQSRPYGDTAKKPIIGKDAVRSHSRLGGAGCLRWSPSAGALQPAHPIGENPDVRLRLWCREEPGLGVQLCKGCKCCCKPSLGAYLASLMHLEPVQHQSVRAEEEAPDSLLHSVSEFSSRKLFNASGPQGTRVVTWHTPSLVTIRPLDSDKPDLTEKEYEILFKSINGLALSLAHGRNRIYFLNNNNLIRSVDLERSDYAEVAKIFYNFSIQSFDAGDYFPVWGTCLGFEELSVLVSGEYLLTVTDTVDVAMPLNFTGGHLQSRMFQNFPTDLLMSLAVEPLTANFHKWSLSMKKQIIKEKVDEVNEMKKLCSLPAFYGVQWHPEKAPYEWKKLDGISHAPKAVKTAFYLAEFFVNEARKNNHHFRSESEEEKSLIYHISNSLACVEYPEWSRNTGLQGQALLSFLLSQMFLRAHNFIKSQHISHVMRDASEEACREGTESIKHSLIISKDVGRRSASNKHELGLPGRLGLYALGGLDCPAE
ncbi:hypothetical protein P7K49_027145 [Saguinus oedipus]|uniref:folate gamma-glutamyl hydrolase n=1 Tax=Saguinus oedipus TaxID=9490 RepID=A0ABQ9UF66_SAGOE|nr:hypothetical protein P7K49_027145 [Saguinus oedipus]